MRYSEFREYLKSNDFEMRENEESLIADNQFEISKRVECSIRFLMDFIEYPHKYELLKKVIELAETPISEREEEKRYYLRHRFMNAYTTQKYFNYVTNEGAILSNRHEDRMFQTKFTLNEINDLAEKFDTDFSDFEIIEVEEDKE